MQNRHLPKLLWLTNLPAPYRFEIWNHLADSLDLEVAFLLKRKNWRNWPEPEDLAWKNHFLSYNSIRIREYDVIPSFRGVRKLLRDKDFAIIGGWESPMYIVSILLAKKWKIPVIQFYGSFSGTHRFAKGPIARFRRWIMSKPDRFCTISKKSTDALVNLGVDPSKILTLFNCVDGEWFHAFAEKNLILHAPGHHFIYVGQLLKRKNLENTIRAFSEARDELDTLTIAGGGNLENELRALVNSLGLREVVIFRGNLNKEHLAKLFTESDTLILASIEEVWGLVVNEALASGLHVVVSAQCGVSQLIRDMHGVEVCEIDTSSIAAALTRSRQNYTGHIRNPEILQYSPRLFAEELNSFLLAI
jgi:glycosyltransferase involved in cell wall biosynthesis